MTRHLHTLLVGLLLFSVQSASAQCDEGQTEVIFQISTDPWGYELYWELLPEGNDCGDGTIEWGGNDSQVGCDGGGEQDATGGNGYGNNSTYEEGPYCLEDGVTYTFTWIDDWGDGGLDLEIYQNGELTDIFDGTGQGNTWTFTIGESSIPPHDFPCIAYEAYVGETDINLSTSEATVTGGEPAPAGGNCGAYGLWCEGGLSNTIWISFEGPESGTVQISSCNPNTNFDSQLAVYSVGDCTDFSTFSLINSNDDTQIGGCEGGNGYASDLFVSCLTEGETYYIQVDGWYGSNGNLDLSIVEVDDVEHQLLGLVQNVLCAPPKGETGENGIVASLPGVGGIESVSWSGPEEFSSSEWNLSQLPAGMYELTVVSDCGNTYTSEWEIFAPPAPLGISTVLDNPDCDESEDGSIDPNVYGGTEPYFYSWVDVASATVIGEDSVLTNVPVGEYQVNISDNNGCTHSQSDSLIVGGIDFDLGGDTVVCLGSSFVINAPNDFEYEWQDGSSNEYFLFDADDFGTGQHPIVLNLSNDEGCDENFAMIVTVDICGAVSEVERMIELYPNPVSEGVLSVNGLVGNALWRLFDSAGRLVDQGQLIDQQIELDVQTGMYTLEITDDLGRMTSQVVIH